MTEIAILTPDPAEASHGTLWPTVLGRLQRALDRVGITAVPVPWTSHVDDARGLCGFSRVLPLLAWGYHFDHARWLRAYASWQRSGIARELSGRTTSVVTRSTCGKPCETSAK